MLHDVAYRRTNVADRGGASVASWSFVGNRVAECALGNGITCSFLNDARTRAARQPGVAEPAWGTAGSDRLGYDGLGRAVAKRFLRPGHGSPSPSPSPFSSPSPSPFEQLVVGFTTAYDKGSRKLYERHLHAEGRSHRYDHDSADRLTRYTRGTLAAGGASVASPTTLPGTDAGRGYDLDGLGNWEATDFTPVGGLPAIEARLHNAVNQITLAGTTALAYDHGNNTGAAGGRGNGNLTDDGTRLMGYDALNRLTTVRRKSDVATVAQYAYDAANRRVRKAVSNGGVTGTITNSVNRYLYSGWQCAEERDGANAVTRQFVWGMYIDELIQQRDYPSGASLYPLADLHYRTTALADASGAVVEAYDYDAYGRTMVFGDPRPDGTWFTAEDAKTDQPRCEHLFQGGRYQPETGLYHFRNREYHTVLGRWIQQDPAKYADGLNLYQYVTGRPVDRVDPQGLGYPASYGGHCGRCVGTERCCTDWQPFWQLGNYGSVEACADFWFGQLSPGPRQSAATTIIAAIIAKASGVVLDAAALLASLVAIKGLHTAAQTLCYTQFCQKDRKSDDICYPYFKCWSGFYCTCMGDYVGFAVKGDYRTPTVQSGKPTKNPRGVPIPRRGL